MNFLYRLIEKVYLAIPNNLAYYDSLTSLYNRNWWDIVGKKKYCDQIVYVTMIDIDNLKDINDTYGHCEGDKCILGLSNCLKEEFKHDDIIHLGGDEFIVVSYRNPALQLKRIHKDLFRYGIYQKQLCDSICDACKTADKRMYVMKKELKKAEISVD